MSDTLSQQSLFKTSQLEEADADPRNPSDNPTMGEIISRRFSRRGFLRGSLAVSAIAATVSPLALMSAGDALWPDSNLRMKHLAALVLQRFCSSSSRTKPS